MIDPLRLCAVSYDLPLFDAVCAILLCRFRDNFPQISKPLSPDIADLTISLARLI
jgi:hypothetical protein